MESNTNTPKTTPPYQEPRKKVPMFLIALVITLSVVAVLLAIKLYIDNRSHKENIQFIENEKQKLESQLNGLIIEYDSLKVASDSMDVQLTAEQDKIRRLLQRQASSATKIRMYQRELETLRKVMRSYIVQIDSLNTRNQELTAENIQVRGDYQRLNTHVEEITKQRDELSSTVKLAQKLTAKNIVVVGLNDRSREKDKIKKIEKIRVCFTVLENNVAEAGNKTVYLRIIDPNEQTLPSPENGMFEYNDEMVEYSASRELEYENADIDMCIYWDIIGELVEGTYFAVLYSEGYEIGSTSFVLK